MSEDTTQVPERWTADEIRVVRAELDAALSGKAHDTWGLSHAALSAALARLAHLEEENARLRKEYRPTEIRRRKRKNGSEPIDEVVAHGFVHLEDMGVGWWYLGVYTTDGEHMQFRIESKRCIRYDGGGPE
jgi:hypothetical protein